MTAFLGTLPSGLTLRLGALALVLAASGALAEEPAANPADEEMTLAQALARGKTSLTLRYRFENVADDVAPRDAHASTLRTALGYRTAEYRRFSLFAEAENVAVIGNDLYNNRGAGTRANGVTGRPVVADPAITEVNQAYLRYAGESWQITAGRQEILLGDTRFVGNVGWRQNHQSFDALRFEAEPLDRLRLTYAYVDRVHRIFGDSQDIAAHLLHAGVDAGKAGTLTLYAHLLDYRRSAAASTATYGLELSGRRPIGDGPTLLYEIEYARQSDYANNPGSIDAGYSLAMIGLALPRLTARIGREVLEGDSANGRFTTPLATLHKFNGWADKFLATPAAGLEDVYLQLDGKTARFDWLARYHDFDAESGAGSYGSELDLQLLYRAPKNVRVALTGALYDADAFSTDTEKWMLWVTYGF